MGNCRQMESDFNPLPRKEGDHMQMLQLALRTISIHSLVKRETSTHIFQELIFINFNPLPRKEGDRFFGNKGSWL